MGKKKNEPRLGSLVQCSSRRRNAAGRSKELPAAEGVDLPEGVAEDLLAVDLPAADPPGAEAADLQAVAEEEDPPVVVGVENCKM